MVGKQTSASNERGLEQLQAGISHNPVLPVSSGSTNGEQEMMSR